MRIDKSTSPTTIGHHHNTSDRSLEVSLRDIQGRSLLVLQAVGALPLVVTQDAFPSRV